MLTTSDKIRAGKTKYQATKKRESMPSIFPRSPVDMLGRGGPTCLYATRISQVGGECNYANGTRGGLRTVKKRHIEIKGVLSEDPPKFSKSFKSINLKILT